MKSDRDLVRLIYYLIIVLMAGYHSSATAQNQRVESSEPLERISGDISIDGLLDEAGWDLLTPLPLTAYEPGQPERQVSHPERQSLCASRGRSWGNLGERRAQSASDGVAQRAGAV